MSIEKKLEQVMELKTVGLWMDGVRIYGLVKETIIAVETLPVVAAAAAIEVGAKKTKKYIDEKQTERFEELMKQYNMNNTTKVAL